jgi:twinkle protein
MIKIFGLETRQIYEIETNFKGENKSPCPSCSEGRKKKTDKCFSFNSESEVGFCIHCSERFVLYKPFENEKYLIPEVNLVDLRPEWKKDLLEKRCIGESTIKKLGISEKDGAVAFPFYKRGQLVNCKYRRAGKKFSLESGCELVFYNYDALLNNKEIIITEGEIDTASFIEEGFDNCISVPNGASIGNMKYLDSAIADFDVIEKFYIAVDNDNKGIELRDELVRRLGANRCWIVTFQECKDANELLVKKGRGALAERLKEATQIKMEGTLSAEDNLDNIKSLFKNGMVRGALTGFPEMDSLISWEAGRLCTVTGSPASGKSEVVDDLCTKLSINHGWKCVFYSPESQPMEAHFGRMYERMVGKRFREQDSGADFWNTYEFINQNMFWVNCDTVRGLDNILERFLYFIKVKGVKIVVIDPFNFLSEGVSYEQYGAIIGKCSRFAREYGVLFFLVAHPKKPVKDASGFYPLPTAYDISGSSDFFNRSDYIISLRRHQDIETKAFISRVDLAVQKVKTKNLGQQGLIVLEYDFSTGRYSRENTTSENFDKTNWLKPKAELSEVVSRVDNNTAINAFEAQVVNVEYTEDIPF